ncbi:MAG: DUF1688 family protein [Pseudomonadota bacterium]
MTSDRTGASGGSGEIEAVKDGETAAWLLTAEAVRIRSAALFERIRDGRSDHFSFEPDRLQALAQDVAALTKSRFPDLAVPFHARWRHFEVGGHDRFASLAAARNWHNSAEASRAMGDLAILSVLLDAGAGAAWHFQEAGSGQPIGRSEGLALASFAMFANGTFSSVPADPLRADAQALAQISEEEFARAFQISADNPLEGAEGRLALLSRLAAALRDRPDIFALEDDPRPGGIVDALAAQAEGDKLPASQILATVLEGLGNVWPSRHALGGRALGDCWPHPQLGDGTPGSDLVPFHKLSTWLSLSLVEPLQARGVTVTALDALPGLAEYRNGGLFLDGGALVLKTPGAAQLSHAVDAPIIVEWRAATVTLLSAIAPMIRDVLGVDGERMPLASVLEGGTWLMGRQLAKAARADGSPPLAIISDGTVF